MNKFLNQLRKNEKTVKTPLLRILVINLHECENVLLMTPLLSTLRENYSCSMIDVLLYEDTKDILAGNRDVYLIYTLSRCMEHYNVKRRYREEFELWNSLRFNNYDLIINLSEHWRAALYCKLLKPTFSLGFRFPRKISMLWKVCHNMLISVSEHESQHVVLNYLSILEPLELTRQITSVTQSYRESDVSVINMVNLRFNVENYVFINVSGFQPFKNWTVEGFVQVINHLTSRGEKVLVIGAGWDRTIAEAIVSACQSQGDIVNITGRFDVSEVAVLIERAKIFVGVDSVFMHMASAYNIPSVVLLGVVNINKWSPWEGVNTILWAGVYRKIPKFDNCNVNERYLDSIPAKDVIEAIDNILYKEWVLPEVYVLNDMNNGFISDVI